MALKSDIVLFRVNQKHISGDCEGAGGERGEDRGRADGGEGAAIRVPIRTSEQ